METRVKIRRNITTTLPQDTWREIGDVAQELRVQKNDIIAESFTYWNKRRKQELLAESYKKMATDPELIALADEGLEEWIASNSL